MSWFGKHKGYSRLFTESHLTLISTMCMQNFQVTAPNEV